RHRVDVRAPGCFGDRFGVIAVVLGTFDEGLHILRRDQTQSVAQRGQRPGPVMGAATGFHDDLGGRKLFEERYQPRPPQIQAQHWLIGLADAVQGEHGLGRVDGYELISGHGRLRVWLVTTPSLACDAGGPSTPTSPRTGSGRPPTSSLLGSAKTRVAGPSPAMTPYT